jgi:undecaprenyl-diphosphatase
MELTYLQPLFDWITQHQTWAGIVVFLIAFTESLAIVGLFIPGAILMLAVGALIGTGTLSFWPTFWWAVGGAVAGDGISFWAGRYYKQQLRNLWPFSRYPALLDHGERFLEQHGGKSVLFGRFFGPVRAIIPASAGIMGMLPGRFLFANVGSALVWAPAFLLPGMVFGASLNLAAEVASRLAMMMAGLIAVIWFSLWVSRRIYRLLTPRAMAATEQLARWGRSHPQMGKITAALLDPQQPETKGLAIVAITLVTLAWLILRIFEQFSITPPLARLDHSTFQLLQGLRTPWGDQLMTVVSQLGDGVVQAALVVTLTLWLLWRRNWLATGHWLAAALFAALASWSLKQGLQLPRPQTLYDGVMGFSFPSAHTVLATCLYGFLSVLVARELPPGWRWLSYAGAWLIILSIAFSRLYLGAHWFSDVLGGLLLGLVWITALGAAYRRHLAPPVQLSGLLAIPLLTLATAGSWHVVQSHEENLALYAPRYTTESASRAQWLTQAWQVLPSHRIDTRGVEKQPLNLQWSGTLAELQQQLSTQGWRLSPPLTLKSAMQWINPKAALTDLPHPPLANDGQPPALVMTLPQQKLLLRLWPSVLTLNGQQQPVWIGHIGHETLTQLPFISFPSLSGDFDTPLQQFKPFVAAFNVQLVQRTTASHWHGEVMLLWSSQTTEATP